MLAAIRVAIDLKLFEKLSESGDVPTTVSQLASASGADVLLIGGSLYCFPNLMYRHFQS